MPRTKSTKPRKSIFDKDHNPYGTYDTSAGYGNEAEWSSIFSEVWSQQKCIEVLKQKTPFSVLGVAISATWEEVKSAFKKLVQVNHPDKGGDEERCKEILAAYSVLKAKFGK